MPNSSGNPGESDLRGTESGTVADDHVPVDPDLRFIVEKWPGLPEAVPQQIAATVRAMLELYRRREANLAPSDGMA